MAGDVGFDPLGLSGIAGLAGADLYWMREAELKHGRVAMLATVGVLWCDAFGSLPGFPSGVNQMKLFWEVWAEKPQAVAAGLIFCGIAESEWTGEDGGWYCTSFMLSCVLHSFGLQQHQGMFVYVVFIEARKGDIFCFCPFVMFVYSRIEGSCQHFEHK